MSCVVRQVFATVLLRFVITAAPILELERLRARSDEATPLLLQTLLRAGALFKEAHELRHRARLCPVHGCVKLELSV